MAASGRTGSRSTGFVWILGASIAALAAFAAGAAGESPEASWSIGPGAAGEVPAMRTLEERSDGLLLEVEIPAVEVREVAIEGDTYQALRIPGGGSTAELGRPDLPSFARLIRLPDQSGVHVHAEVEEERTLTGIKVAPMPAADGSYAVDPTGYSRADDAPLAEIGRPALMRGTRVAALTVHPVRYDPATSTLRVATRVRLEVVFDGVDLENVPARRIPSGSFGEVARGLVVNAPGPEKSAGEGPGTWLLICRDNATIIQKLTPLIEWRRRMGFPVYVATTTETGTTADAIKAFIQNAYDTWENPPEYVVLAGDVSGSYGLPCWYENLSGQHGEGDHPYVQLEGNDILPDAHVGRISFSTFDELDTIVAKILGYEKTPYMDDTSWFTRACLVGDPYDSGISTVMVQQWTKSRLREIGYTEIDTVFNYPFTTRMLTDLNRGDTIFSYRGIYGVSGWNNSLTYSLSNGWKLNFAVVLTCGTGSFASGTSYSEAFIRAGSATTPKSSVGAVGTATIGTHTRYNNCMMYGIMQGLLYENDYRFGEALSRGKLEMYLNYYQTQPNTATWYCYWNNLMGDPATELRTAVPRMLDVTHPTTLAVGANSLLVQVNNEGEPVAGARVCVQKGLETWSVGLTDEVGLCELPVALLSAGTAQLTVSGHDLYPYLADVQVSNAMTFVGYRSSTVSDGGDGIVNPGEEIELAVELRNFGSFGANGVSAVLASGDPYVEIIDGQAEFGDIAGGANVWGQTPFRFRVSEACADAHVLRFGLDASDGSSTWHSMIEVPVVSADLVAHTVTLGNAGENGILDPGETVQVFVRLENGGGTAATAATGRLIPTNPYISVPISTVSFGTIPAGGSGENASPFLVHAYPETYDGFLAVFRLITTFNGGAVDTTVVTIPVGQRATDDPVGPDQHGYLAYDNTDTRYPEAPVYQWIEIDPNQGGQPGTSLGMNDTGEFQDCSRGVTLPFPFRFYGEEFTGATVCSNGWVAMGSTYLTNYRNWTLPGAGAPPNIVAVFWDDLFQYGGGQAYHWYDSANHRWIVEWSRFRNREDYSTATFQAIFLDPAWYPTETGDGQIIFQYNTISNPDVTDGRGTVGIANADHTDGLLYTYYNLYPAGAAMLAAGRAIRITPTLNDVTAIGDSEPLPVFGLAPASPNPFRASTSIAFTLDRSGPARLLVVDPQGRIVRRLLDGTSGAGVHRIDWDGRDDRGVTMPSGVYFYRLESGERTEARKAIRLE